VRLRDFAIVEFARAWQEEAGASLVDPVVVDSVIDGLPDDPNDRLLAYADALLLARVEEDEGRRALAHLRGALDGLHVAAPILGVIAGASLLLATLPPADARPVNVFLFAGEGILLPALFGVLTAVLSLGGGRALARTHWLAWLGGLLSRGALSTRLGALTGRVLRISGVSGPLFGSLSHLFWIGALSAFTGLAAWRFLFTDYLFAWSSTMPLTGDGVRQVFSVLAAPVSWLPGVGAPTPEQVSVSEWASLADSYARGTGDALRDEALRKGWFGLLLAAVAAWGVLPRVLLYSGSRLILRRRVRSALDAPAHQAVLDALSAPRLTTLADGDGAGPASSLLPPPPASTPASRRTGLDVVAFATAAPAENTLIRLRLDRLGLSGEVHVVSEDDDDDAMDAALAHLSAGAEGAGGAIVALAVTDSPGRLREAFLRDVVGAVAGGPVHLVLTGVDAFRRSPRGRSLPERHAAWVALAERIGVPADRVHADEEVT
jgi:hypothetical protein